MEVVIETHPAFLTIAELLLGVADNPQDRREIDTITCAVRGLRGSGLLHDGHDKLVEPTPAALRLASLLLG
jgi:hypothetical protein